MSLHVSHLRHEYPTRSGPLTILKDITFALERGQALAIMGPSGSGKSTLLNNLGAMEKPTNGEVTLDGVNPYAQSEALLADFRNQRIGFVFQEHHLLPQCSVLENVLIPTLVNRDRSGKPQDRARQLLERVGLSSRLEHRPAELSGGERQRVAVARALVNGPTLLLADEPTGNLDRSAGQAVGTLLLEMAQQENTILIAVTHSPDLASRFALRMELNDGLLLPMM